MADYSNMHEQATRTAKSRDRQKGAGEKKMMTSQNAFYEAMAKSAPVQAEASAKAGEDGQKR